MKLSEFRGEEASQVLGEILEPIIEISQSEDFKTALETQNTAKVIKYLMKDRSKEMMVILAPLNRQKIENFNPTLPELIQMVGEFVSDPDVWRLFH